MRKPVSPLSNVSYLVQDPYHLLSQTHLGPASAISSLPTWSVRAKAFEERSKAASPSINIPPTKALNPLSQTQTLQQVVTLFKAGLVKERLSSRHKDVDESVMPALAGCLASSLRNGTSVDRTLTALEIYSAMVDVWLPGCVPQPRGSYDRLPVLGCALDGLHHIKEAQSAASKF